MYKYLLAVSFMAVSASSYATSSYKHCETDPQTAVCQAYLQGLDDGKKEVKKNIDSKSSFQERALEQRSGERYRRLERFNRTSEG